MNCAGVEGSSTMFCLTINTEIFNPGDVSGIYNWLMEIYGFKTSLTIEQVAVWFAHRKIVKYRSSNAVHIDSFCEALDALDMVYTKVKLSN